MSQSHPDPHSEFVGLLLKAQPRIYALLRTLIPNRVDADDVFQDVVTVLWTKFDEFELGTDFQAWAYQTARFKVQHYYRTHGRQEATLPTELIEVLADESQQLGDQLDDLREALSAYMEKLRPEDREIVRRYYGSDATVQEVSDELGRPVDTVKSVLKRSRRQLYACIRRTVAQEGHP